MSSPGVLGLIGFWGKDKSERFPIESFSTRVKLSTETMWDGVKVVVMMKVYDYEDRDSSKLLAVCQARTIRSRRRETIQSIGIKIFHQAQKGFRLLETRTQVSGY